ncbi:unnamed protein product, partial [Discosporangium mesarthrocarpum]
MFIGAAFLANPVVCFKPHLLTAFILPYSPRVGRPSPVNPHAFGSCGTGQPYVERRLRAGPLLCLGAADPNFPNPSDEKADRIFSLARSLHLRRHRSPRTRDLAVETFLSSLRLRPDWIETDARFAVGPEINDVFAAFADGCDTGNVASVTRAGVEALRAALQEIQYTAPAVISRFGGGAADFDRLPGPYFVRKNIDHTQKAVIERLGPPEDALDVAIRIFLLGLAVPRSQVEACLGPTAFSAALVGAPERLGFLAPCPGDPIQRVVSLVQLFPLDANAQPHEVWEHSGGGRGMCGQECQETQPQGMGQGQGKGQDTDQGLERLECTKHGVSGVLPASELVFATDWPPPGSSSLSEDPVMYIGPDSIGLVQHAPRWRFQQGRGEGRCGSEDQSRAGSRTDGSAEEQILDLCCGSGIQGIAAAAVRSCSGPSVTCVDISPRAVRFTRLNALLNGMGDCVTAIVGDLYHALNASGRDDVYLGGGETRGWAELGDPRGDAGGKESGGLVDESSEGTGLWGSGAIREGEEGTNQQRTFDLILANPPFVPVPPRLNSIRRRYDVFSSGGPGGEEILRGVVAGAREHLRPRGALGIVSELANPTLYGPKLKGWWMEEETKAEDGAATPHGGGGDGGHKSVGMGSRGLSEGSEG